MEDSLLDPKPLTDPAVDSETLGPDVYLLISDLDDTLLGDDAALEEFQRWFVSLEGALELVYASGRFVDSIAASIAATNLPPPVATIGGVGSEIRDFSTGDLLDEWRRRISDGWRAERVKAILAAEDDLELQPEEFQSDYKVSYFLHEALPSHLQRLNQRLREGGIDADYIYSSQRDLDFLPAGVNKGAAGSFYANHRGFRTERVLVSGNSGNDASLFRYGFRGVIVANAHDELKALAGDRHYLAGQEYAAGVKEGVQHWMRRDRA